MSNTNKTTNHHPSISPSSSSTSCQDQPPPHPVSIMLRNQFILNGGSNKYSKASAWSYNNHHGPLLLPTTLEVFTTSQESSTSNNKDEDEDEKIKDRKMTPSNNLIEEEEEKEEETKEDCVLFRASHTPALHPRWDFDLEDFFVSFMDHNHNNDPYLKRKEQQQSHVVNLEQLRVRICTKMTTTTTATPSSMENDIDLDGDYDNTNDETKEESTHIQKKSSIQSLGETTIDPNQLRHLPDHTHNNNNTNMEPSSISETSLTKRLSALPPNSILIEYSDGSTRCSPQLYDMLLDQKVIIEQKDDLHVKAYQLQQERKSKRFSEDVFDLLDSNSNKKKNGALMVPTTTTNTAERSSPFSLLADQMERVALKNDDLYNLLDDGNVHDRHNNHNNDMHNNKNDDNTNTTTRNNKQQPPKQLPYNIRPKLNAMQEEISRYEELLRLEELEIQQEEQSFQREKEQLKLMVQNALHIEKETLFINEQVAKETEALHQNEFQHQTHQIKLLRDLRRIYPLQTITKNRYSIRNLEFPSIMNFYNFDMDHISTTLGYVSHLVFVCSKILEIPLRYKLLPAASRSVVYENCTTTTTSTGGGSSTGGNGNKQTQSHTTYVPLFLERNMMMGGGDVARLEFDRGVLLLERDIECLCKKRGVAFQPRSHMLAKLDRLFEQMTEGGAMIP